jgi:hypothetical protein
MPFSELSGPRSSLETSTKLYAVGPSTSPSPNRARAAYRATSYAEGDNTWSHFVAKAIEAETARREAENNDGGMYPSWGENLPGGRRLKDS